MSCTETDIREATFQVPGMCNQACAEIVRNALAKTPGVVPGSIKTDIVNRTVSVDYESLETAKKNLEHAVADAGFATGEVPANPEAAACLPEECRGVAENDSLR